MVTAPLDTLLAHLFVFVKSISFMHIAYRPDLCRSTAAGKVRYVSCATVLYQAHELQ